jgi:hypothetical protein
MLRPSLRGLAFAALLAGLGACLASVPLDSTGYACDIDADCGGGLKCLFGYCDGPIDGTLTPDLAMRVYRVRRVDNNGERLSLSAGEVAELVSDGGYISEGVKLRAGTLPSGATIPIYQLVRVHLDDWLYVRSTSERDSAIANYGYESRGILLYMSAVSFDGGVTLHRLQRGSYHRYAAGDAEKDQAVTFGWNYEFPLGAGGAP